MKKRSGLLFFIIPVSAAMIFSYAASYQSASAVYVPPPLGIRLSSDYFNPVQEQLVIYLPETEMSALGWRVEILEPHPSNMVFQRWVGRGQPPEHVFWDGKNFGGEWVHSASEYPLVFYVCDTNGNIRTIESSILVDAFIISEGGKELVLGNNI